jgi:hypothetical protein
MRSIPLALAAAFVLTALPGGKAEAAAFCAYAGGTQGYENCGYYTFQQCLVAISGVGGFCMANPHRPWVGDYGAPPRRKHRRHAE